MGNRERENENESMGVMQWDAALDRLSRMAIGMTSERSVNRCGSRFAHKSDGT